VITLCNSLGNSIISSNYELDTNLVLENPLRNFAKLCVTLRNNLITMKQRSAEIPQRDSAKGTQRRILKLTQNFVG